MIYYYGGQKRTPYFEGWYLKCQTRDGKCLALIPAIHTDAAGNRSASVQVITQAQSWWLQYSADAFSAQREIFRVQIGNNTFSELGMQLNIHEDGIDLEGKICFGQFKPLKYSIMGPFHFIPNMECAHGVISMSHSLKGEVMLNGQRFDFHNGIGYIESDRGTSFPSSYLWAQDIWPEGSFMLSIAKIPLWKRNFTGCICALLLNDKEYRIATYLGAQVTQWSPRYTAVRQGRYLLEVEVLDQKGLPLKAPSTGAMIRTVHESICSAMRIRFTQGDRVLLERLTRSAGFEYSNGQS